MSRYRRPSEQRPIRTAKDLHIAAVLAHPVPDEETADEFIKQGMAEVQATWSETERQRRLVGNAYEAVDILVRSSDYRHNGQNGLRQ